MHKTQCNIITTEYKGKRFRHVPGNHYHDVNVFIYNQGKNYRVKIKEVWGSAQGYDEEHGHKEVIAINDNLNDAIKIAMKRVEKAGNNQEYLIQAVSYAKHSVPNQYIN